MANELYIPNISLVNWDNLYDTLGVKEFVSFISSPQIQHGLLPAKIVFILFTVFFLAAIMYFYKNSTFIYYNYLQGFEEFADQPSGFRGINKRWKKILKRVDVGTESEYKLAIIEADDLLQETLEQKGYTGETFEQMLNSAQKNVRPGVEDILSAHEIRNSIVYHPDYKLDTEMAKILLANYDKAIKSV